MIFDQYQRYGMIKILVENIKKHYKYNKPLKILELGSNEHLNLQKFLSREDITFSDLEIPNNSNKKVKFIKADATNLKDIKENEFDIVISTDVFEHIPELLRKKFLKESKRVARVATIHCFPFKSDENESAENSVNEYYKSLRGIDHIWIKEHIDNGLPDIRTVIEELNSDNCNYFMFEHGDILLWEEMTKIASYTEYMPELPHSCRLKKQRI